MVTLATTSVSQEFRQILSEGEVPWPDLDNTTVRQLVLGSSSAPLSGTGPDFQ